jgi:hypothetical protein
MNNLPLASSQYIVAAGTEPLGIVVGTTNLPDPPTLPNCDKSKIKLLVASKFPFNELEYMLILVPDPDIVTLPKIEVDPVTDNEPVIRADPVNGKLDGANDADVAVSAYEADVAVVDVVAVPTNDPLNDPVATTVIPTPVPSNASIIFVICVGDIVPPAVMPVLLIVAIYVVPFFVYRPIFRPFI